MDQRLTEREQQMLDLEREAWTLPSSKETEIRSRFGISPSSYYKALAVLVERPEAFEYDPLTVLRIRRQRDHRRRARFEGPKADPGRR